MKYIIAIGLVIGTFINAYAAVEAVKDNVKLTYKNNGGYESVQAAEHVTPEGTKITSNTKVDVDVDHKGRVTKVIKSDNVIDPKGLTNKQHDTIKIESEEKSNGGYRETDARTHIDANGANVTQKVSVDVDVDKNGNVVETDTIKKTVDPKGLFNKTTSASKTKIVNGTVVEQKNK